MKNIFKKENLMPVIVLGAICLVVAALMGAVNMLTGPIINKAEEQKIYDSLREVLDGEFEPAELPADAPSTVTAIYKVTEDGEFIGNVVTLEKQGYASKILLTVGIDKDGKTTKVVITSQQETHGKDISPVIDGLSSGISAEQVSGVDHVANATKTSEYIKAAVADAFTVLGYTGASSGTEDDGGDTDGEQTVILSPKTDAEILALCGELVPSAAGFEDITPTYNKPATLIKLYKETSGLGYVAYVVTAGQYVPVANEGLVHISPDGDIVDIDHLTWIVGHGASAEGFAEQFIGKDNWTVDQVELISGATVTSADFYNAVASALDIVTKSIERSESKILSLADKLVPNSYGFEKVALSDDAPATLKAVYKEQSGKGYVAHIITAGEYVAVATESLVYFDGQGTVKDVMILVWNVGHGIGYGDLDQRLIGANSETIGDVELVTAATYTSQDLRNAIADAMPHIPRDLPVARIAGIVIICLSVVSIAAAIIVKRRKRV